MRPDFDVGDHLHLNDAGYRAMGDAVEAVRLSRISLASRRNCPARAFKLAHNVTRANDVMGLAAPLRNFVAAKPDAICGGGVADAAGLFRFARRRG